MHAGFRRAASLSGAAAAVATTLLALSQQPASGAASPITIGYISSLTGVASSTFFDGPGGARARIDLQNAEGGVHGHKIDLVVEDDQSSPATNQTVSQELVENRHVLGIVDFSAFVFGGARYLQQQGVPVTGGGFDGPEWGQKANVNMFDTGPPLSGPVDGKYYTSNAGGKLYKELGVTKLAGLAYGISESSQLSIELTFDSAASQVQKCYENLSVPFGGVDFTADVLQIKQAGCNGVVGSFVDASDVALSQAVKDAGIKAKQFYFTGYDQNILDNPTARAAADGDYFTAGINFTTPNAPVRKMLATLRRYDPSYKGGIPDYGVYGSYLAADLMIKGLEVAGTNPTRASFITNLRKVGSYNAGGILPSSITFRGFGTPAMVPKVACGYEVQLLGAQFHVLNGGKPLCGHYVPISSP